MNLLKYDNKCVRIIDIDNECYEGICSFNGREYNEFVFGKKEDSVQILNIIFYKSCIKRIEELDSFNSTEYGALEELIIHSDIDVIEDALDYEEEIHNERLLLCMRDHMDEFEDKEAIERFIEKYSKKES